MNGVTQLTVRQGSLIYMKEGPWIWVGRLEVRDGIIVAVNATNDHEIMRIPKGEEVVFVDETR